MDPEVYDDSEPKTNDHPKHDLYFEAAEHHFIGNSLILNFNDGTIPGSKFNFTVKKQSISLGDIVALAGDFYGNYATMGDVEQISDKWTTDKAASIKRFLENAELLSSDKAGYLTAVLEIMAEERKLIAASVEEGRDPAQEYAKIADSFNKRYALATGLAYLWISLCNWDHFGQDAIYAYSAGHTAALAQAKVAHESGKGDDLRYAYFLEGFALHFLTDLFSSGHLRPPRRILHATLTGRDGDKFGPLNPWPADACSKEFHDEDCANGLFVTNHLGVSWPMYGDGQLFSAKSAVNLSMVLKASQIGVDEVWKVFQTGDDKDPSLFVPLKWVPDLDKLEHPNQFVPLFKYDKVEKILYLRENIEKRASASFRTVPQNFLGFWRALSEIEKSGTHINRLPLTKDLAMTTPLIQLQKTSSTQYIANKYGSVTSEKTTAWNMVSQNIPPFSPEGSNWASPAYLSADIVLSVTGKEPGEVPRTGYAGYKLDFSGEISNPIQRLWQRDVSLPTKTPDTAIPGRLATNSETYAFTPSPQDTSKILHVFTDGIEEAPTDQTSMSIESGGLMIQEPININQQGLPPQLLARAQAVDNKFVQWSMYGWDEKYETQLLFTSKEESGPIISEQWWRYATGDLLKDGKTTQIVRLLYGEHAKKDILQIDVVKVEGNPPVASQVWTKKYQIVLWDSPKEDRYVKWLLLDVTEDGNLDLVTLINTDESTLTIVVFPSQGDYSFGEPTVSKISIPDSKFNPSFFKSVSVEPAEFDFKDMVNMKSSAGILQLFDNYQILGARLLGPVVPKSLQYELKGQTPALAGQMSVGAGPAVDSFRPYDLPGFLTKPT